MGLADWHHNFRLVPVRVIASEPNEDDYTLLAVYQRKHEYDDTGTRLFSVRASEALALGDMLRLWAQGEMDRRIK